MIKIDNTKHINFQRRLKNSEETEYLKVLKEAKNKIGNTGKSILIVPTSSLPNETGMGNLGTNESMDFFDFAQKYWGINEIQILPSGQYHQNKGKHQLYSSTSMTLGNHMINIKDYACEKDYQFIIEKNKENLDKNVNFDNIIDKNSPQEIVLKKLHKAKILNKEFIEYKLKNKNRLERSGLFQALHSIHNTPAYETWPDLDKNLFNEDIVPIEKRHQRIEEIYKLKNEEIDFFFFKQFLADDSLKKSKEKLNKKGIKLNADLICNISYDEIWANPKSFRPNKQILWGIPALNLDSKEGESFLREKIKFYLERFDGIRVDASWTYINQPIIENGKLNSKYYGDKFLKIIDEEAKKVKGENYDLCNIMHEFAASKEHFNIFDGNSLRAYIAHRTKIYTSDHIQQNWGSNSSFISRGWNKDKFIIGARNHDSGNIAIRESDAKILGEILKIPYQKLLNQKEFIKAKLAEPMSAKHNMLYFLDALNIKKLLKGNNDKREDYKALIPRNFRQKYFESLQNHEGFNPMDALEKNFIAQGLDKTEPELYKKVIKYKKILEQKETHLPVASKCACVIIGIGLLIYGGYKFFNKNRIKQNPLYKFEKIQ